MLVENVDDYEQNWYVLVVKNNWIGGLGSSFEILESLLQEKKILRIQ
jgi:hypothetical protein